MSDGRIDGKFTVEAGSNFSRALSKELGLTNEEAKKLGGSLWNQIFTVARGDKSQEYLDKVLAGQEFDLSGCINDILKLINDRFSKLGHNKQVVLDGDKDQVASEKKSDAVPENCVELNAKPHEPKTIRASLEEKSSFLNWEKSDLDSITNKYNKVNEIIKQGNEIKNFDNEKVKPLFEKLNKDNIAYVLKEDPEFFTKLGGKISGNILKPHLLNLLNSLTGNDWGSLKYDSSKLINEIKNFAATLEVKEKPTEEDYKLANEKFEKRQKEVEANNAQRALVNDKNSLKVKLDQPTAAKDKDDSIDDNAEAIAERFKGQNYRDAAKTMNSLISKETYSVNDIARFLTKQTNASLTEILAEMNRTEKNALMEKLSIKDVDYKDLTADKVLETARNINNEVLNARSQEVNKHAKFQKSVNDATNKIAEMKNNDYKASAREFGYRLEYGNQIIDVTIDEENIVKQIDVYNEDQTEAVIFTNDQVLNTIKKDDKWGSSNAQKTTTTEVINYVQGMIDKLNK